jgi:UDP-3-O-[3-hydroxymyristoyl] N-acetylglucosamine deacetylase/3-hydroxyacyl-[acyl-carrier-protein] dehydratase
MIDYQTPVLGGQHTGLFNLEKEFVSEFSDARTFCFLHEVEALSAQGLIKGGNLDNAIVIVEQDISETEMRRITKKLGISESVVMAKNGILNNRRLRHKNEPARHKLLDLMGDLALAGVPLRAQILAARPGHAANVEFARKIRKLYLQKRLVGKYQTAGKAGIVFDAVALQNILPHRYPFLLVDRIVDFVLDEKITGIKNVTMNDWFFEGHFPGQPVMPGVLIIEAMAQAGGLLLLNAVDDPTTKIAMFTSINNARFRRPVVPGDQLVLEVSLVNKRSRIAIMAARAFVAGELVAEAELSAAIVDRASAVQRPAGNGVPNAAPESGTSR